jgi:hypothetical protein
MRVAGYDAWYATVLGRADSRHPGSTVDDGSALLVMQTATCHLTFAVRDRARTPLAELIRIVEAAQLADCTNKATWFDVP